MFWRAPSSKILLQALLASDFRPFDTNLIFTYGIILPLLAQDNNEFFVNISPPPQFHAVSAALLLFSPLFPGRSEKNHPVSQLFRWKQGDVSFFLYFQHSGSIRP